MKLKDFPPELKELGRLIEFGYKYRASDVFCDWIEYLCGGMLYHGQPELAVSLQKKYGNDYIIFQKLNREWLRVMDEQIKTDCGWFDALGTTYESIGNTNDRLGQFFTPPQIVDFMTHILFDESKKGQKLRINDPCSGSGRMSISIHAFVPGNYVFACDIDSVCAKMSAINMAIHGCRGQIICGNSLFLDKDWRFGYEVNPYQQWMTVPHLLALEKENCMQLAYSEDMLKSRQISVIDAKQGDKVVGQQLTIF